MGRAVVGALSALILAPVVLLAQTDDLRTQIRADVMADPRSSQMSESEIDALVEAIAVEAETAGISEEYLEAKNSFNYETLFEPPQESSQFMQILVSPISLAVLLLMLVLGAVVYYIVRKGKAVTAPDLE